MSIDDVFCELIKKDSDEFDIFLDTLKEVFEEDIKKGIKPYER